MKASKIIYHRQDCKLEIVFGCEIYILSAEYLRVFSPSAEVQGHSLDQYNLQHGKRLVQITNIKKVGNYAISFVFSDGHSSGIYSWDYLYDLGKNYAQNWGQYLSDLNKNNLTREPKHRTLQVIGKSSS